MKKMEVSLYLYEKLVKKWGDVHFPCLTIQLSGPEIVWNKKKDGWNDESMVRKLSIPIWVDLTTSEMHWSFSLALIVGFRVSYQWDY